jgi:stage V sporulation protein AC
MKIKDTFRPGEYGAYVKKEMPKSEIPLNLLKAFWVGGAICVVGEAFRQLAQDVMGLDEVGVAAFASIVMIALGAFLTSLGIYDVIGKYAGGGSIVPITGFANSIVAPAMEYRREGFVLGVGAQMFTVAGPVLVYGIAASLFAGIIYFFIGG